MKEEQEVHYGRDMLSRPQEKYSDTSVPFPRPWIKPGMFLATFPSPVLLKRWVLCGLG